MYDSDYCGLDDEDETKIRCHCNSTVQKCVAFEGCWTGRRFLACAGMVREKTELFFGVQLEMFSFV
jgi:hypothetical protein